MKEEDYDAESERAAAAAAQLHRLAQAAAMLRMFRENQGHDPELPEEAFAWANTHLERPIVPEPQDYEAVNREHPDLVALANRSIPFLLGEN